MFIISILISFFLIIFAYLINKKSYNLDKLGPIESGIDTIETKVSDKNQFFIKYYIIAILFLIFDLETIVFFPFNMLNISSDEMLLNYFFFLLFFILCIYRIIL